MKTNTDSESVVPQQTIPQEDPPKDDEIMGKIRKRFNKIQERLDSKMHGLDFEIQVFYDELQAMIEETFENNHVFNQDIPEVLDQLKKYELTPELLEAYDQTEQLDYAYKNNKFLAEQTQNPLKEILHRLEEGSIGGLQDLNLRSFLTEILSAKNLSESKAEMMFLVIKSMRLFSLKIDEDGWSVFSFKKGHDWEIGYGGLKNIEKLKLKIDKMESIEMIFYGLSFLLENCFEKAPRLCLNLSGRYLSNQEAERFNNCGIWKDSNFDLAVDFRECTFESEDTPLMFFRDLEDLTGARWFLENSNATQKTVDGFCELMKSRIKSLKTFAYGGFYSPGVTSLEINAVLLNFASELQILEFGFEKTAFNDDELIAFSENVLPELKNICPVEGLKLWLGWTQVTDRGLKSLFKTIENNCANRLKVFLLRAAEDHVTDESIGEFALNVLPLMENLEDFTLSLQKTLITDKSMIDLCRNIKYFASKLKTLWLSAGTTAITDTMIETLALESMPLMKQIKSFDIWFNQTKVTDKSLGHLFASMASFVTIEELEFGCTESSITDESVEIFTRKALPEMVNLKKFNFYGSKTKFQDAGIKYMFQNLSKASQLQKMVIWLNDTAIGEESLLTLAETISSLVNLKNISLSFYETKLGDLGISSLWKSLKPLASNLESLKLDFNDSKITDEGILTLDDLRSLKEFKLFVARTKVGDLGLKPLLENLQGTMASIQDILLRLSGSLITDESVLALAEKSLPQAENLRTIELWASNTKLSDVSLVPLMEGLKSKVHNIYKLDLRFQNTKILNETLKALSAEVLANTRNLQDFQLNFAQCQVSYAGIVRVIDSLASKAQRLRNLVLQFNDAISDSLMQKFAEKVLPNLSQIQDFKLTWTGGPLSSPTLRDLCVGALNGIKNIKTFKISSSEFSVTTSSCASLKELSFELNNARMNDVNMKQILESLEGRVSQVKNFSFLVQGTSVSSSSIKTLVGGLVPTMLNLESAKLALGQIELSDEIFGVIDNSFENFASKLKEFQISLRPHKLNDSSINTLANCGLAHMTNLEILDIEFTSDKNYNIEPAILVNLFGKMQNCVKKLKDFSFAMFDFNLPLEAIQTLATNVFPNLLSITYFFLGLERNNLTDSEFSLFFSGLKGVLKEVKFFGMVIKEAVITDQAFDYLWENILPELKSVKNYVSYVDGNGKINDETFINSLRAEREKN